ncbi:MAG: hypothetical protein U0V74_13230 [Chitinophagales bacterium]
MKTNLSNHSKEIFFPFLNGDISITDFEKTISTQNTLEDELPSEIFSQLLAFDFKDKYAHQNLVKFLNEQVIDVAEYETWKIKTTLNNLIADPPNLPVYLNKLYQLYCGQPKDDGLRIFQFRFLGSLGLNYFYWMDEGYLKANYGENWKLEYEKCLKGLDYYHQQLKPFAVEILDALENREIIIRSDGTYQISEPLKQSLEGNVYQLIHPKHS